MNSIECILENHESECQCDPERLQKVLADAVKRTNLVDLTQVARNVIMFHLLPAEQMAELNQQYLQHEGLTDVITFSYLEEKPVVSDHEDPWVVGEIFVAPCVAAARAPVYDQTFSRELLLYLIHGILHLIGLDDQTAEDAAEMRRREADMMNALSSAHSDLDQLAVWCGESGPYQEEK
ncbi:MAG: rRNA maturation RNase YbeY [Lentisphaerae bacterium]|nr:MAG: rRNA maturation RNase YbeY [Lentisphaerota bacterium]